MRTPYFCSGCPHNSSTVVPEGSRAYAGIGCHYMAQWMDRSTLGFTQMGGEGANWIGEAPFSKRPHVFQNIGDGTYNHSGYMAIRAAIASGVNITYKILYNDAVAMTGGQTNDGGLTVPQIARAGRGRRRQARRRRHRRAGEISARHRVAGRHHHPSPRRPRRVQRELARGSRLHGPDLRPDLRRRKAPPPQARHISRSRQARHHQRTGLRGLRRLRRAVELRLGPAAGDRVRPQAHHRPVELQQGFLLRQRLLPVLRHRARRTVEERHRASRSDHDMPALPEPTLPRLGQTYNIIVTGVGGTGVVTIGAHSRHGGASRGQGRRHDRHGRPRAEGRRGLQPCAHRRARRRTSTPSALRPAGPIWCSAATSWWPATRRCWPRSGPGRPRIVVNTSEIMPGEFTRNADYLAADRAAQARDRRRRAATGGTHFFDATRLADRAVRQFARRQHVHARLRLSAWRAAAVAPRRSSRRSS